MFDQILHRLREKIRFRQYIVTLHADEEMDNDDLTIFDVETAILTGKIHERQKDKDTGDWKYRIVGKSIDHRSITVIAKISTTEKLVVITTYQN